MRQENWPWVVICVGLISVAVTVAGSRSANATGDAKELRDIARNTDRIATALERGCK